MRNAEINRHIVYEGLLSITEWSRADQAKPSKWVKTREVADVCGMSIYSTRIYLLDLVKEGKVICSDSIKNNSLWWHPKIEIN
ncbi:FaeA/PapI family transcriptional regulator [Aeromonas sp. SG16]|uniref:FaeA/PapI family transcriptional regulator n=1 Tax=Aeromonas sp. SG16 TaxID=2950548 RepID=UPI00210C7612|nr:FaeA/PapI family transcriptional regulator [Aeromonas sp. SG16]MCQ4054435.1 FaeA/PapI family transcriptional regulator [Aeromonas sp. SG16]